MARISSSPSQYYRHNYAKVCMTGVLGCRWHRYKQSTKDCRKRDVVWFVFLLLTALFVISWFYMVLIFQNDKLSLNEFMYSQTDSWLNWFTLLLAVITVLFAYILILVLLSLCHILLGQQLYIHPCHIVYIFLVLTSCVCLTVTIHELWRQEWAVVYISLQIFGPFLQIGAVCVMTVLSWIISHQWFKATRLEWRIVGTVVYVVFMICLYISPLFMKSPCVILTENLPPRPQLFAHRGAMAVAPENTVISFETASSYGVFGIETDVRISNDGVLFVMHDSTLHRTTDVEQKFPSLSYNDASSFNISQLTRLSTGKWYIEHGPGDTADNKKEMFRNQSVPLFLDILTLAKKHKLGIMFDLSLPDESHPYYNVTYNETLDVIKQSGINHSQIYWASPPDDFKLPSTYNKLTNVESETVAQLKKQNFSGINVGHENLDRDKLKSFSSHNLTTNVYTVNTDWLYSFYWCLGVDYVATSYCNTISQLKEPIWHMTPQFHLILWIATDCVSAGLILLMFYIQRRRLYGHRYRPDRMGVSSHNSWGAKRSRRSMKQKLILADIHADTFDFEPNDDFGIDSNGYEITVNASDGFALSQAFHSNRTSYTSEGPAHYGTTGTETLRHSYVSESEPGETSLNASMGHGGLRIMDTSLGMDGNTVTEINFTRNGSVRNSFHDNSTTSSNETDIV